MTLRFDAAMTSTILYSRLHAGSHRLIELAEKAIAAHEMLSSGEAVLIGVSGGPDSVALLCVLSALAPYYGYRLGIAHLHHGLRNQSADRDARFVERLAKQRNLPYYIEKIDLIAEQKQTGQNLEEAGRHARYRFFRRIAAGDKFDKIAVGHHGNDNAELILMNLLRGSGPVGISGLHPKRQQIIRPLIYAGRNDILSFLSTGQIPYRQDPSNDNTFFQRNHIRHHLMPALQAYNPGIVGALNRLGEVIRDEDRWIDELTGPLLEQVRISGQIDRQVIDIAALTALHIAAGRRILRKAVEQVKGDLRRIAFSHIEAALALANSGREGGRLDLPDRVRITCRGGRMVIAKEKKSLRSLDLSGKKMDASGFEYHIEARQAVDITVRIEETGDCLRLTRMPRQNLAGELSGRTMVLDWDRLAFPLTIRNVRPGDRFMPLGLAGRQKIKDFFINHKISANQRRRQPLITDSSRIICVAGMRIDERVKITTSTTTVLKAVYIPAAENNTHECVEDTT